APLTLLLIGPAPPGLGLWWDLSMALGFAGLAMMGVQFVLTARFRRVALPFGIDVIYNFHRRAGIAVIVVVIAHPVLVIADNPATLAFLNPVGSPLHMVAGVLSIVALLGVVITSVWRKALRIAYEAWRATHVALAAAAV